MTQYFLASMILALGMLCMAGCEARVDTTDDSSRIELEGPKVERGDEDIDLDPTTDDDIDIDTPIEGDK